MVGCILICFIVLRWVGLGDGHNEWLDGMGLFSMGIKFDDKERVECRKR